MQQLPPLETLRCFVEVARLKSFRAAARAVHLTPAAVGVRIKLLEERLGQSLFHRTTRKVTLTPTGLALLPQAQRTLAEAAQCLAVGSGSALPPKMELTLGTRHELGMSFVLPALTHLEAAIPGLTCHLYFGSAADLLIRVRTLEVDAAIGSMVTLDPALDTLLLQKEDYIFVGHPQLLKRMPLRTPQDAVHHTLLEAHPNLPLWRYVRDAPGGPSTMQFGRVRFLGTIAAIHHQVKAGLGVAVLPRYLVQQADRTIPLQAIWPKVKPLHDHFRLIVRRDDPRRSILEKVAQTLRTLPLV